MGKKSKKSGSASGKKKKGGKKGKSGSELAMTWREALLAYQIANKERFLEDLKYELRGLKEQNNRALERNERLKMEQSIYLKNLLKEAKDFEKKLAVEKEIEKKEVIKVMMEKWEVAKLEEKEITTLKEQMAHYEAEIITEEKEVSTWKRFKAHGCREQEKQIALLEQELVDMETNFMEMSGHLERTMGKAKDEITEQTEETLEKQKHLATEKAMAKLDKKCRQEVLDNDWLKKEVDIHKAEATKLLEKVEQIEKSNLRIMSELFECTVDDLRISRNFYLTQFGENDNLQEVGILEMDLANMSLPGTEHKALGDMEERPQSVMDVIAEKVLRLGGPLPEPNEHIDSDETDESDYDTENGEPDDKDPFEPFFKMTNDDDYEDFLQLGPLELKLLNVTGKHMTIYRIGDSNPGTQKADSQDRAAWPVTHSMLKDAMSPCTATAQEPTQELAHDNAREAMVPLATPGE